MLPSFIIPERPNWCTPSFFPFTSPETWLNFIYTAYCRRVSLGSLWNRSQILIYKRHVHWCHCYSYENIYFNNINSKLYQETIASVQTSHHPHTKQQNMKENFLYTMFCLNPLIRIYNFEVFLFISPRFQFSNTSSRSALPTKLHFPSCFKREIGWNSNAMNKV